LHQALHNKFNISTTQFSDVEEDQDSVYGTLILPVVEDGGVTLAHLIDTSSL